MRDVLSQRSSHDLALGWTPLESGSGYACATRRALGAMHEHAISFAGTAIDPIDPQAPTGRVSLVGGGGNETLPASGGVAASWADRWLAQGCAARWQ